MPSEREPGNREIIANLVHGFSTHIRTLRDPQTLEAVVRQEYIDPFWTALGWDVANAAHRSAAEKDVLIEAPVGTIEGQRIRRRRPDYLFRIHGFPRFVVEAKQPSVDLASDRDAIFQAKTYAWSAQIPFSILTDFEEFRLFDATIKPRHDEPGRGVVDDFDLRYDDYPTQWDVLWNTFSRSAVAQGSLERLLARIKRVRAGRRIRGIDRMLIDLRGSEPVDRAFLKHLEDYRERFARRLYLDNRSTFPSAHTRHGAAKLTEAAQRLIDRLVFLRVCEDRNVAAYGGLREDVNRAVDERADPYPILITRFRRLDREYNGYLFKPHFSEELTVPGQLLADFVESLYLPEGPYRFDAIGDDLLGIIYERFLGSVITVRRGRVQAEEKPEVRHAGGVYYTPRFVVDTIIRRVIGPQLEGRAPKDVLDLKILDPACGSGSFLIAAFHYLMDHCVRYFAEHPEAAEVPATPRARKRKRKLAFQDDEGQWNLAPDFKAALLTSCLHGVDIDPQAVEVTIMSLYLKMLEGKLPPNWQRDWLENELLPPLDNNIRCGNSLLSQADFDRWWDEKHGTLFAGNDDTRYRMNPFDWSSHTRGFARVLESRDGFDAIIGNPPYIRVQELNKWAPDECEFYKWHYRSAQKGNYDIYVVFIERALQLLAPTGLLGFITPHKYWQAKYGEGLRKLIAGGRHLRSVIDFTDQQVFRGGTTYTAIQVFSKAPNDADVDYARITDLQDGEVQCRLLDGDGPAEGCISFASPPADASSTWNFQSAVDRQLFDRLSRTAIRLHPDICRNIFQGIITGADPVFLSGSVQPHPEKRGLLQFRSEASGRTIDIEEDIIVRVVRRQGFKPYVASPDHAMILPYDRITERLYPCDELEWRFPLAWKYLSSHKSALERREKGRFKNEWWCLSRAQNIRRWCGPKVLVPYMINKLQAVWDSDGMFFVNVTTGGYGLELPEDEAALSPYFLVGLLNNRLLDYCLRTRGGHFHGGYFPANKQYIENLPIKLPETATERRDAERVIERVRAIIEAKKRLQSAGLGQNERERLERRVETHEAAIDQLVYKLYGLSDEDIRIVERATAGT